MCLAGAALSSPLTAARPPYQARAATAQVNDATYQAVVAGMRCRQGTSHEPQLDCTYRVGTGVEFVIAGIGDPAVSITVVRATGYDTDYYVSVGMAHGCVIVKPGRTTREAALKRGEVPRMAFVSPVDGKVYHTWEECGATKPRR
jgi:hypothetical protein